MDENKVDSQVTESKPKETTVENNFDFIERLTDEEKGKLAKLIGAKYYEENKSLKEYKAKIQKEKDEALRLKLEEEGKFKELAEIHQKKVKTYQEKLANQTLKEVLLEKGISKGALNLALSAYSNKIEIDENDNVVNLEQIVNELETNSPEIFQKPKSSFIPPVNTTQTNKPIPYSEWSKLNSEEKLKVKNERGVDYTK